VQDHLLGIEITHMSGCTEQAMAAHNGAHTGSAPLAKPFGSVALTHKLLEKMDR
jgi:hypothetical protein